MKHDSGILYETSMKMHLENVQVIPNANTVNMDQNIKYQFFFFCGKIHAAKYLGF